MPQSTLIPEVRHNVGLRRVNNLLMAFRTTFSSRRTLETTPQRNWRICPDEPGWSCLKEGLASRLRTASDSCQLGPILDEYCQIEWVPMGSGAP